MEAWIPGTSFWFSQEENQKHLCAYVEPAGLAISGWMEDQEWQVWTTRFKKVATEILGYKIGEIETGEVGHDFIWLVPELKVLEDFRRIANSQDETTAWDFLELDTSKLTELEEIELEKKMFKYQWHHLHDILATHFQNRRHPSTAKFLFESVLSQKIPEFEYKPVSRKCIWALADIGTEEAKDYLKQIANSEEETLVGFAKKRLDNWEQEKTRKGRLISGNIAFEKRIKLELYSSFVKRLPEEGRHIVGFQTEEEIVVYQAYKPAIAKYAVEHQRLGGKAFSYKRMSWIKPNFLWMMHRCGWAEKENQERVLAICLKKKDWEEILSKAVFSSYQAAIYKTEKEWKEELANSEVRLQWDPAHDPYGEKLKRKAIQIGMKGEVLRKFGEEQILYIQDITPFVSKQKIYVDQKQLAYLEVPLETVFIPTRNDLAIGLKNK